MSANDDNIAFLTQIIVNDMSFQLRYKRTILCLVDLKAHIRAVKNMPDVRYK